MLTREQAHELLDLCLDINGNEKRQRSKTGELPTTFFWFDGHVCDIDIFVHENGWTEAEGADKRFNVCLVDEFGDKYKKVKEYLLELKKKTV